MSLPTASSPASRRGLASNDTLTFDALLKASEIFASELRASYEATRLEPGEIRLLTRIKEPIDVLAIIEDSHPDALSGLPILARIEEANDKIRLRILRRDDDRALGGLQASRDSWHQRPTYVFSDRSGAELGIISPPTDATRARAQIYLDAFFAARSRANKTATPELAAKDDPRLLEGALDLRRGLADLERSSIVLAIGEIAATAGPARSARSAQSAACQPS